MTERIIVIASCKECPRMKYVGGYKHVSGKPHCNAYNGREIPSTRYWEGGVLRTNLCESIPEWCPLGKKE